MKKDFKEFKDEILKRAKEARACRTEYNRAYRAEKFPELILVITDNFNFASKTGVIDEVLIEDYRDEFEENEIYINVDADEGYLFAFGNATVEAFGNATVEAFGNATVRATGNATVRAWDNATVEAFGNATVEAFGNATVIEMMDMKEINVVTIILVGLLGLFALISAVITGAWWHYFTFVACAMLVLVTMNELKRGE